jgi:hypothetical protein
MPRYLLTLHAYRSWSEDHPRGYVQRRAGLKPPSPNLAHHRAAAADWPPVRFTREQQALLHHHARLIAKERNVCLHATCTTRTHLHVVLAFQSPACPCGAQTDYCHKPCPARQTAADFSTRLKRKAGQQLAIQAATAGTGRKYFSRGRDLKPIRTPDHLHHLLTHYLPRHVTEQAGTLRLD